MKIYNDEKFPTHKEIEIMNIEYEKLQQLKTPITSKDIKDIKDMPIHCDFFEVKDKNKY